jgi:hypothetical protein
MRTPTWPRFLCSSKTLNRFFFFGQFEEETNACFRDFAKCFITNELVRWPKIDEFYGAELKKTAVLNPTVEGGQDRLKALHERVVEHVSFLFFYWTH